MAGGSRSRRRALAVMLPAVLGAAGCETILGVDFGSARLAPPLAGDGGDASAAEGGALTDATRCDPIVPPERPADLPQATDTVEFTLVIRSVDFGDSEPDAGMGGYFAIGYDQDGVCTGRGSGGPSCVPRPWLGNVRRDGPHGEDNSLALLMIDQAKVFGVTAVGSTVANDDVAHGVDAPMGILRVRAFGGLSKDDHVEVDWFVADRLGQGGDAGVAPAFDETDVWPIVADTVEDPKAASAADTVSKFRDANAFVVKNVLVAHLANVQVPLRHVPFELSDLTLTAELSRDPASGKWGMSKTMVGARTTADGLLHVIPQIAFQAFGVALCTDNQANYPAVKRFICSSADLPATRGEPTSAPCAAASFGMTFEAAPAKLGKLVSLPALPISCAPSVDPRGDTCATEQSP